MLSLKFKTYALVALVVAGALLGWRSAAVRNALAKQRHREDQRRLKAIQIKQEIDRDVTQQDDSALIDRLTRG